MYTIYIDDALLFSTGMEDEERAILSPKLSLDINGAGSLTFTMPPGHALYDAIHRMKSIVTVVQNGVVLFRGRVLEDERDFYNQKNVYCEGDRSFLLDSLWAEQTVSCKVHEFFRMLIDNHNSQVEEDKRFTVGVVTAVGEDVPIEGEQRIETRRYWDTATVIEERLMGVYGGYLHTRTEGDTHYIDWLSDFEEESSQPIKFSVNLLDLKDKMDAGDVFTCLIPLGYSEIGSDGAYTDPVDITSVNDGCNYIQDDDAVALYGKIWRSKTWGSTKDPAQLLAKAREHMKMGKEVRTLTLTAVDMHFEDGSTEMIRIGTKVQIESSPHGIDMRKVCAKMDIDLENPENTPYTFGEPPKTLTEGVVRAEKTAGKLGGGGGGGGRGVQEELTEILRWAKISVNEANSLITANAGKIDNLTGDMSSVELILNGDEGDAGLIAKTNDNTAAIQLNTDDITSLVTVKADKVYVDAEITAVRKLVADEIEAVYSDVSYDISEKVSTKELTVHDTAWMANVVATSVSTGSIAIGGTTGSWKSATVVTGGSVTTKTTNLIEFMKPDGTSGMYYVPYTFNFIPSTKTIYYFGYEPGGE